MEGPNTSQTTTKQRIRKLQTERALEVKREGVKLTLIRNDNQAYLLFLFDEDDHSRLTALIQQEKYALQLCLQNGNAMMTVMQSQIYDISNSTFLLYSPMNTVKLDHLRPYYLMKQNASNSVHKSMLFNVSSNPIADYIEERINQIPLPKDILMFPYQQDLNQSQNQALKKVGQNSITFIKGPPGCGKTKTIARLSKLLYEEKKKVIVGSVSNIGNLRILNQLIKQMIPQESQNWINVFVNNMYFDKYTCFMLQEQNKYNLPNIVLLTVLQTTQENLQFQPVTRFFSLNNCVIRNMWKLNYRQDMSLIDFLTNLDYIATKNRSQEGVVRKVFSLYRQALKKTISEADILITTTVLSASIHQKVGDLPFKPNVAILDQASQATWGDTYCYLSFPIKRLVLVGDEKQLDPTVISQDKLLKETVFSKRSQKNPQYFVMLNTQYRMHPQISEFPNFYLYQNQLKNGVTHEQRSNNIFYFSSNPLSFINHRNIEQYNQQSQSGKKNYYNEQQIRIIKNFILLFRLDELKNVGIISPYTLQVKKLTQAFQHLLLYGLTIKSCDGYQGGEKDFIIFSCVRSNKQRKIGFCGEKNRINVSLTRARKALLIVGNAQTLAWCSQLQPNQNIWHSFIGFLTQKQKIFDQQNIMDYLDEYHHNKIEQLNKKMQQFQINEAKYYEQYLKQTYYQQKFQHHQQFNHHPEINQQKKEEERFQRLIQLLQTKIGQEENNKQDENQQLEKKNKKLLKEIRKYLQNLANKAEKSSPQQFKQFLNDKHKQFCPQNDIINMTTRGVQSQASQLLRKHRSQAIRFAGDQLLTCLKQVLECKQLSNHLKLMQVCLHVLRKSLIYQLTNLNL